MKRILIPLLVLALLCVCAAAPAEENNVTLELNTAKLQAYAAGDPFLDGLTAEGNTLPVIVMNVNRSIYPQVTVLPTYLWLHSGRNEREPLYQKIIQLYLQDLEKD